MKSLVNTNVQVVENIWTDLMDQQTGMSYEDQTKFLEEWHTGLTNREVLAIVGELFLMRTTVEALREQIFPNGKDK